MALSKSALHRRYNKDLERYKRANDDLKRLVERLLTDLSDRYRVRPTTVFGEMKKFDDFYEKALDKESKGEVTTNAECFEKIRDIARARVVCQTLEDCNRLHQLLLDNQDVFVNEVETELWAPSVTGYRAIHLSVEVDVNVGGDAFAVPCELQILSALQNCWTLYTHEDFYKGADVGPLVDDLMRELSDLLYVADKVADRLIREVEQEAQ